MLNKIKSLLRKIRSISYNSNLFGEKHWDERFKKYGQNAVLNLNSPETQRTTIFKNQKKLIKKYLISNIEYNENSWLLDFGCGGGRFSYFLSNEININVVGCDISQEAINFTQNRDKVFFVKINQGEIPVCPNAKWDIVFSCLCFGGINNKELQNTINKMYNSLNHGGVIFFIENTSNLFSTSWIFRSEKVYKKMFSKFSVKVHGSYFDNNEKITIFSATKEIK